jgi:hypothetical protein
MNQSPRIFSVNWKKVGVFQSNSTSTMILPRFPGAHGKKNSTIVPHVSAARAIKRTSLGFLYLGSRRGHRERMLPVSALAVTTRGGFAAKLLGYLK